MERIQVSVRARPLSGEDARVCPWRILANSISLSNQSTKFEFDRIFSENCRTEDVYLARTRDIVAAAVGGFNGTVFAYGQTSSGKTYTMRGTSSDPGVIPLAVHDLFNLAHADIGREFLMRMSYLEIYNEEINDLLAPEHTRLQIHESIERGIYVAGLREEIVSSADQVLKLMEFGEARRHIGETNMNMYSSRSHTIFRMIIESRERTDIVGEEVASDAVRVSVLNLVDLAGSERASKTGAEGVRLKEGSHINKSLLILGTVIKKLSEGAESQGGHVPYRDSKLTRILQPALGGNANTAIICNITLAPVHVDETKSSLQFASRALRVTNHAHVNEIMTDAALLKRQKKEIEELREKLQGLRSENLEVEILNLRNTLLTSELERERIALELEEEKRAQAEKEKRLQEQEKKIENLSSMFLCATREESRDGHEKEKRRYAWCPRNLGKTETKELSATTSDKSESKSYVAQETSKPLLPFEELVEERLSEFPERDNDRGDNEECSLPDPHALLHVTSRRKNLNRRKNLPMKTDELSEMHTEYEKLLLKFEAHRIVSDIQIDCLTRKLSECDLGTDQKSVLCSPESFNSVSSSDDGKSLWDAQLQEKSYAKVALAQEEIPASEGPASAEVVCTGENEWLNSLRSDIQEVEQEFEKLSHPINSLFSVVDEAFHLPPVMTNLINEFRASSSHCLSQIELIVRNHEEVQSSLRKNAGELADEKHDLDNQAAVLMEKIEDLNLELKNSADAFQELTEKRDSEKFEFLCQFELLQREIASLSFSALSKEKEAIRKDLEKTKLKLKDTEFKLKNSVQERTRLEGDKSSLERELKRMQSQKSLLERDMSKRESVTGRMRDQNSYVFDQKQAKDSNAFAELEEEHKRLELLAVEMEAMIASLEDQLAVANEEKNLSISRAEDLESELHSLSEELQQSRSDYDLIMEEAAKLKTSLEESSFQLKNAESSLITSSEEKEVLSMQFADALMCMEEEKAVWASKELDSIAVIKEIERTHATESASLSKQLSEVRSELDVCSKKCVDYEASIASLKEEQLRSRNEKAKFRMRLRACGLKLESYGVRYNESLDESDRIRRKYEAASTELKNQVASCGTELLRLKKQLAACQCTSRSICS